MPEIEMNPVNSSMISAVGYDAESETLRVEFSSGRTYEYRPFSAELYTQFINSPSLGRFFHSTIKGMGGEEV